MFVETIRKRAPGVAGVHIEIRPAESVQGKLTAHRLMRALAFAGWRVNLGESISGDSEGVLIEGSLQAAKVVVALQSVFSAYGLHAHLLIRDKEQPNAITIELGDLLPFEIFH